MSCILLGSGARSLVPHTSVNRKVRDGRWEMCGLDTGLGSEQCTCKSWELVAVGQLEQEVGDPEDLQWCRCVIQQLLPHDLQSLKVLTYKTRMMRRK